MEEYIKRISEDPSFKKEGFNGYKYKLDNKNVSITLEDSYKGHDVYCKNTKNTCIYYVVEGQGKFKIDNKLYEVNKGDIIEIPNNIEFTYIGKMKLLYISAPSYQKGDFENGRLNDLI